MPTIEKMALKSPRPETSNSIPAGEVQTKIQPSTQIVRAKRDAAATKERILRAGIAEFARHGFNGARIERIARRARSNMRMIYHYFGSKERLYLAVLERIYQRVRSAERQLHLSHLDPAEGMARLIHFTFAYLLDNPEFVNLVCGENLLQGKYLKKSTLVPETTLPLVEAIRSLLERGQRAGVFRKRVDPVQLYVTILSVCFTHISNRHTLSIMFQKDVAEEAWLEDRRAHVVDVIQSYLRCDVETAGLSLAQ